MFVLEMDVPFCDFVAGLQQLYVSLSFQHLLGQNSGGLLRGLGYRFYQDLIQGRETESVY